MCRWLLQLHNLPCSAEDQLAFEVCWHKSSLLLLPRTRNQVGLGLDSGGPLMICVEADHMILEKNP